MTHSIAYELEHGWRECDGCGKVCLAVTMLLVYRQGSKWLCAECHALDMAQHPATIEDDQREEFRAMTKASRLKRDCPFPPEEQSSPKSEQLAEGPDLDNPRTWAADVVSQNPPNLQHNGVCAARMQHKPLEIEGDRK